MEDVLKRIQKKFISLDDEDIQRNNAILYHVVNQMIKNMKILDPLFNTLFSETFYGGSFYDGLKIEKPNEFDLDLLLDTKRLKIDGKIYDLSIIDCDSPGFVQLHCDLPYIGSHRGELARFRNWFDDNLFLNTQNIKRWMEGLVKRSVDMLELQVGLTVGLSKGGPASTIIIYEWNTEIMSIDFVPCFIFDNRNWPRGFRPNPFPYSEKASTFFVVPKEPDDTSFLMRGRYWRLSFQKQERLLIINKGNLKPSIKFLKLLKKKFGAENYIASYYIKTILLHMINDMPDSLWFKSLSVVFMVVLKEFRNYLAMKCIPYYWDIKLNLLEGEASPDTLDNLTNRIHHMIKVIEKNPERLKDYLGCHNISYESNMDMIEERVVLEQPESSSQCNIL